MDLLLSILSLIGFILLTASTGLFVAVEFALTGLERATIDQDLNAHNDSRAHAVKRAFHNLSFVLSGAQLGITITTLATGYLAEPILAKFLNPLLHLTGLSETWTTPTALVLALIIATFLSMVFGELVPKNIAITNPIRTARFTIQPVHAFNLIFKGFITLLNKTANALVRAIGIEPADELATARSAQELTTLVRNSVGDDGFDETIANFLGRSLLFGATTAEELMTPRSTIETLSHDDTILDLLAKAATTGYSRFPVVNGDLDDTIGIVHYKDAFAIPTHQRATTTLGSIAHTVRAVPESLDGDAVLNTVRAAGAQVILVKDEYGGTAGLITIEDVIEEILGDVYDEHDNEEEQQEFHQNTTSTWTISGLVRLDELEENLGYLAPEGPYETLGGLIMYNLGRIPKTGDELILPPTANQPTDDITPPPTTWHATVLAMEDRRVDKVLLTPTTNLN